MVYSKGNFVSLICSLDIFGKPWFSEANYVNTTVFEITQESRTLTNKYLGSSPRARKIRLVE